MNRRVKFDVLGTPAPQGSKTVMPNGAVLEGSSTTGRLRHRAWRTAVAEAARDAWGDQPPANGPVRVSIELRMPRPKSARKDALWAAKRPDLDKIVRSCLDALRDAGIVEDDSRVVDLWATKQLSTGWTGARIEVAEID